MASINLLPRKEFEITLDNGTIIKGHYGTWSLRRFCDRHGLSLSELQNKKPSDYTIGDIIDFILYAVEQKAREDKQPFSYTDVDSGSWIDELGGIYSDNVTRLFNHQVTELPDTEKKTELPI